MKKIINWLVIITIFIIIVTIGFMGKNFSDTLDKQEVEITRLNDELVSNVKVLDLAISLVEKEATKNTNDMFSVKEELIIHDEEFDDIDDELEYIDDELGILEDDIKDLKDDIEDLDDKFIKVNSTNSIE